jgi:hypothetical protein
MLGYFQEEVRKHAFSDVSQKNHLDFQAWMLQPISPEVF